MKNKTKVDQVSQITDKMDKIRLSDEEVHELRALQKNYDASQKAIGILELDYLAKKSELVTAFDDANKSLKSRCGAIAKAHGVDLNKGNWNFELDTPALVKVE